MSLFSAVRSSWNTHGYADPSLPFQEGGPTRKGFRNVMGHNPAPRGLLNEIRGDFMDVAGLARGRSIGLPGGGTSAYGGGIFTPSGWREITHGNSMIGGKAVMGARRSIGGMAGKLGWKALGPALFLHQAATEGIVSAVKEQAMFSGAMWGLKRIGLSLASPLTTGAALLAGAVIGGREALIAGRNYSRQVRKVSFGNSFNDQYGTAATMRQASLQAMQNSKISGRSALGFESMLLHR